MRAYNIKLHK